MARQRRRRQCSEEQALMYRDRWRVLGGLIATTIILIGMAKTDRWDALNLIWIGCALLTVIVGGIIGSIVYRKRSPW
jgi:hypothetical protein